MLIRVHKEVASTIEGPAHIIISLSPDGTARLSSCLQGRLDSMYAPLPDDQLLGRAVPELLRELRAQLQSATPAAAGV